MEVLFVNPKHCPAMPHGNDAQQENKIISMDYFVKKDSIVRTIWGDVDMILFIFAGAAAEFSLNKAVDWLYFTGKLPADPLGRLFSTVAYSQKIVFSPKEAANAAIAQITAIHHNVETARGYQIPDWAYRSVLFMLIDYSIRAYETLERKLYLSEKEEIFAVFCEVGQGMKIKDFPSNYLQWEKLHAQQLNETLAYSTFTEDLYRQYKKHLGKIRYFLLRQIQAIVVPAPVNKGLRLGKGKLIYPILSLYKLSRLFKFHQALRNLILPTRYKAQILALSNQ